MLGKSQNKSFASAVSKVQTLGRISSASSRSVSPVGRNVHKLPDDDGSENSSADDDAVVEDINNVLEPMDEKKFLEEIQMVSLSMHAAYSASSKCRIYHWPWPTIPSDLFT